MRARAAASRARPPADLLDAFTACAERAPDAPAVRAGGRELSYAALEASAASVAGALDGMAVGPDEIVAFAAGHDPETIALILAIVARGAACLPLDPLQPAARVASMLDDARPQLLIAGTAPGGRAGGDAARVERASLVSSQTRLGRRLAGTLAYVLFTSGSTGRPKGVAMRTRAFAALIDWHRRHPRLGRAARTLQFAALGFDVAFQEIFSTLSTGGTLVLPGAAERRDPWALLALLRREHIERAFLPFVALQAVAEALLAEPAAAPASLRDIVTAGEQLRVTPAIRALFARLPDCVLHNHYGPTETHVVSAHELAGPSAQWPDLPPIGRPLPHVRWRIDGPAASDAAAEGELLLGGACLAAGYIGQAELTRQRFIESDGKRWYRSGDRVRRDATGAWHYLGRSDDQLKIAGHRVEPGDIETILCRHDAVAQAAVVGSDEAGAVRLVAHVVARDARVAESELITRLATHCAALLPEYLRPSRFVLHALLPVTASGKIDRRTLAASRGAAAWRDGEPLQANLAALWAGLLGSDAVDPHANLFDCGARSLDVIHALTELRRRGLVMSVAEVYEHPTVAAQAALLGAARVGPGDAAAAGQRATRQRAAFERFAGSGAAR